MKMKTDKIFTDDGVALNTENIQTCVSKYISQEEAEEKEKKLNKKIENLKNKMAKKHKEYEQKIKELESLKWRFKVGDLVLYDGWKRVIITDLVDSREYKYNGRFVDAASNQETISFRDDELSYFDGGNYEEKLIDKIYELQSKLKRR